MTFTIKFPSMFNKSVPQMLGELLGRVAPASFKALADPRKVIWTSPPAINFYSEFWTNRLKDTPVMDGNWDLMTAPIAAHPTYQGLREHFQDGVEWQKTKMFHAPSFTYLKRAETFHAKCSQRDALYESIAERGLLADFTAEEHERDKFNEGDVKNVMVLIGRDGELIFAGRGWHRLSIAKMLGLESIPVQVLLRHRIWQEIREEIAFAPRLGELSDRTKSCLGHPDLLDLAPVSQVTD